MSPGETGIVLDPPSETAVPARVRVTDVNVPAETATVPRSEAVKLVGDAETGTDETLAAEAVRDAKNRCQICVTIPLPSAIGMFEFGTIGVMSWQALRR
jgi:hypothetical protein